MGAASMGAGALRHQQGVAAGARPDTTPQTYSANLQNRLQRQELQQLDKNISSLKNPAELIQGTGFNL